MTWPDTGLIPPFLESAGTSLPFDPAELELYLSAGYGIPFAPRSPAALVVVDVTDEFCGPEGAGVDEAIAVHRLASGPVAWEAVDVMAAELLPVAVEHDVPTFWTVRSEPDTRPQLAARPDLRPVQDSGSAGGNRANVVVDRLARFGHGTVIPKAAPSAFFDTALATSLRRLGVQTVVIAGCTTSGCVRASVVDARSHGFDCVVVGDAVFDRSATSHLTSLYEISMKYASVVTAAQAASVMTGTNR